VEDEKLTKIYVDLPNHWATVGESMWAVDLGDGLYELRNSPFHAYDLNFMDVVKAISTDPESRPEVREVVRRGGHGTLRVFFEDEVTEERRFQLLESLRPLSVSFERATEGLFALDLEPGADVRRVRAELDRWKSKGWIGYETCEARVPGSFDARPDEDERQDTDKR
jgi:hypothetical protein